MSSEVASISDAVPDVPTREREKERKASLARLRRVRKERQRRLREAWTREWILRRSMCLACKMYPVLPKGW